MLNPDIEQRCESARYAMLRRLAYALRHNVASHLQPIGMIIDVMERRLKSPSPNLAQLQDSLAKVNTQARAAVKSSLDVVAWLAPEPGQLVACDAGVQDCVELLRTELNFRGFALRSDVADVAAPVAQSAIRSVLPAVLLAISDQGQAPADVVVDARTEGATLLLTVRLNATAGNPGLGADLHYRQLQWADAEAIAAAEGVGFARDDRSVSLTFAA